MEREPGRLTHHAFSFGPVYDPERVSFGPLVCHDDHLLGPGRGFDTHRHSDLEIITWVVSGALRHVDSRGGSAVDSAVDSAVGSVVQPGAVAVLSTGPADAGGVEHSEHATDDGPCRFVQMWLRAAEGGAGSGSRSGSSSYVVAPVDLPPNRPVPVAQPRLDSVLWVVRLDGAQGTSVELPTAPRVHAFVVTGALLRSSLAQPLAAGDAFEMTDEPAHTVAAGVPTDLLVWTFHDGPAPVLVNTGGGASWSAEPDDRTPEQERADDAAADTPPVGPLRLMGDHGAFPLWDAEGGLVGADDEGYAYLHRHLGLSRSLFDDLAQWGEDWDGQSHTPEHAARARRCWRGSRPSARRTRSRWRPEPGPASGG